MSRKGERWSRALLCVAEGAAQLGQGVAQVGQGGLGVRIGPQQIGEDLAGMGAVALHRQVSQQGARPAQGSGQPRAAHPE